MLRWNEVWRRRNRHSDGRCGVVYDWMWVSDGANWRESPPALTSPSHLTDAQIAQPLDDATLQHSRPDILTAAAATRTEMMWDVSCSPSFPESRRFVHLVLTGAGRRVEPGKDGYSFLHRCVARMCCKSARHWMTAAPPSDSTQITDGCGVGQLLCFRCMQTITADTLIAYFTHDDRPSISSA